MRVKMFEEDSIYELESRINKFISDKFYTSIIDIKYSCSGETIYCRYSAMIIFEDK